MLERIIVEPGQPAEACVIWLHGLGADGYDFEPVVPELGLPGNHRIRFVFPHAPVMPVTINGGYRMRAWYDIVSPDLEREQDEAGTRASQQQLIELIEHQRAQGIAAERIVLAGFSQGGAIVLHTALRYPEALAGVMALSSYLPLAESVAEERHPANQGIPIFMAHGSEDPVVPHAAGLRSAEQLRTLGYTVEWRAYPMEHNVCLEEIAAIGQWLQRALPTQ